jgi:hypothetical protein
METSKSHNKIMTEKQIEKTKNQIATIRKILADEKRKYGDYDDSRGLRYAPPQYFIKLNDFKGAMTYYRWFQKNFSDDIGAPMFLFEWCITLFKNGKLLEAENKAIEMFAANTYLIDKFLDRPFHTFDMIDNADWHREQIKSHLPYQKEQDNLKSFAQWLSVFVESTRYKQITTEFLDIEVALLTEPAGAYRSELVRRKYRLVE